MNNTGDALVLTLQALGGLMVRVCFHNVSPEPVRMLANSEPVPVFFSFSVTDAADTPVPVAGGGKIDFGPTGPEYVDVQPGADRCIDVDLNDVLVDPLPPGTYRIGARYHNQYGDNCFHGELSASQIVVQVPGGSAD